MGSDASASDAPGLSRFLRRAVPAMRAALRENELSESFREDVAVADDDEAAPPECVHHLTPYPPHEDSASSRRDFWRRLVPTGVSWNATGYTLAVTYGRFDVTGWCDSPGALCAWNLRRVDIDPHKPDHVIETSDCLQCVAFHPEDPAVVAAGSFDGGVYVFDLGADAEGADPLRARSGTGDASHREPVTQVRWTRNVAEASRASERAAAYDVVSVGSDGRAFVWNFLKMAHPAFGYDMQAPQPATGKMTTWGISCAAFGVGGWGGEDEDVAEADASGAATETETGAFLAGSDGGAVFRCLASRAPAASAEFRRRCEAGDTPQMYSPVKFEYEPHAGAVHGVSVNPHDRSVFATCGADGSLRVYAQYRARRTLSMEPCDGALFCVQWSPSRPLVVAAGTASGRVVVYDLSKGGGDATQPTVSFGGEDEGEAPSAVHAVAFNPSLPEYLASADASGVRVWELGGRLRNARSNEARVLGRLARAESPAEAAAALAGGR